MRKSITLAPGAATPLVRLLRPRTSTTHGPVRSMSCSTTTTTTTTTPKAGILTASSSRTTYSQSSAWSFRGQYPVQEEGIELRVINIPGRLFRTSSAPEVVRNGKTTEVHDQDTGYSRREAKKGRRKTRQKLSREVWAAY